MVVVVKKSTTRTLFAKLVKRCITFVVSPVLCVVNNYLLEKFFTFSPVTRDSSARITTSSKVRRYLKDIFTYLMAVQSIALIHEFTEEVITSFLKNNIVNLELEPWKKISSSSS